MMKSSQLATGRFTVNNRKNVFMKKKNVVKHWNRLSRKVLEIFKRHRHSTKRQNLVVRLGKSADIWT